MTSGAAAIATKRSWTDRPEETKNRLGMLIFFGTSALVLFLFFIWNFLVPKPETKTFAATLSIQKYAEGIPEIQFGSWNLEAMNEALKNNGMKPWLLLNDSSSPVKDKQPDIRDNKGDIEAKVIKWGNDLNEKSVAGKDTVVVQLRCHAAVTRDDSDKTWICGLYIQDSASSTPYPVAEFLALLLGKIPAKNIVLVAEICDLKSAPHLGWVLNPVATYLQKACVEQKANFERFDKNLWILCAADVHQTSYYSALRGKTLFQEACEKALDTENRDLSLANYFESIYRHCDGCSNGKQTPRMILANNGQDCFPSDSTIWGKAKTVSISRYLRKPKASSKVEEPSSKDSGTDEKAKDSKAASHVVPGLIHPVSMRQQVESDAKDSQSNSETEKVKDKQDTEERFLFWQLRDQIVKRGYSENGAVENWSPSDFAPLLWRRFQHETASKEYEAVFNGSKSPKYEDDCKSLKALAKSISERRPSSQSQGDVRLMCETWDEFLKSSNRKLWDNELLIAEQNWTGTRKEYLNYIDSISELAFWKELVAEFPELRISGFSKLFDALKTARTKLPKGQNDSVLESSVGMQLSSAISARDELKQWLKNRIKNLAEDKNKRMTWLVEREFQLLLASPLVSYPNRKLLVKAFLAKREQGADSVSSNLDQEFSKMYNKDNIGISSHLTEVVNYCQDLKDIASLFLDPSRTENLRIPGPEEDGFAERFLTWGLNYSKNLKNFSASNVFNDATQSWHCQSLIELGFPKTQPALAYSSLSSAIVVSPKNPKLIELKKSETNKTIDFLDRETETSLNIVISHFDSSPVDVCQIQYSTFPPVIEGFRVSIDKRPLTIKTPTEVKPMLQNIKLSCSLDAGKALPNGAKILITAIDSQNKKSNELGILVLRNASRIDLVAKRLGSGSLLPMMHDNQFELKGPAIQGAISRFSFSLRNKLQIPRKVQVKVFAWPTFLPPRNGPYTDTYLFANSDGELVLPGSSEINPGKVDVPFKLFEPDKKKNLLRNEAASDSQLVFQIVEFEDDKNPKTSSIPRVKGNPISYFGRFSPTHPITELTILPRTITAGEAVFIDFEAPEKFWTNYGLEKLPIEIQPMTLSGQKQAEAKILELDPAKSKDSFKGPVMEKTPYRFSLNIGGYPRAIVYRADPNVRDIQEDNETPISITGIFATLDKGKQNKIDSRSGRYVFPVRHEDQLAVYKKITIETILDFNNSKEPVYFEFSPEGSANEGSEIKQDRWHESLLSVSEDGSLGVEFTTGEMRIRIEPGLEGKYIAKIRTGEKMAKAELIFDKTPPVKSVVAWKDNAGKWSTKNSAGKVKLNEGQTIAIGIDAFDALSEVRTAAFAIAESPTADSFGANDLPLSKPEKMSRERERERERELIFFELSSEHELISGRPSGSFFIVAKTEDFAGNVQVSHTPLEIVWTKKPK